MKKGIVIAFLICLVIALSACGKSEAPKASQAASTAAGAGDAAGTAELKLQAKNFEFDQKEYKVKKGQTVNVALENKEGLHGVEIKGLNVKLDNNTKTASFKADKAGTYDIICTVPCGAGHINMKSKLIVEG
ncbi:cupredoxin domain-containing protein [Paenibacillus cremeus]|uniref:Cytochrome C oxidase subunit II n=1 Tax=Paenibacillus cremeus TaxID=2163881 RepID=A0A559KBG9_9BACL|nr:cupredoxin domain-containing protein [Paenibacillus cremeus]TVY09476.1 cytochrome C oxidase subunit II [Paenibacillus cremeus]